MPSPLPTAFPTPHPTPFNAFPTPHPTPFNAFPKPHPTTFNATAVAVAKGRGDTKGEVLPSSPFVVCFLSLLVFVVFASRIYPTAMGLLDQRCSSKNAKVVAVDNSCTPISAPPGLIVHDAATRVESAFCARDSLQQHAALVVQRSCRAYFTRVKNKRMAAAQIQSLYRKEDRPEKIPAADASLNAGVQSSCLAYAWLSAKKEHARLEDKIKDWEAQCKVMHGHTPRSTDLSLKAQKIYRKCTRRARELECINQAYDTYKSFLGRPLGPDDRLLLPPKVQQIGTEFFFRTAISVAVADVVHSQQQGNGCLALLFFCNIYGPVDQARSIVQLEDGVASPDAIAAALLQIVVERETTGDSRPAGQIAASPCRAAAPSKDAPSTPATDRAVSSPTGEPPDDTDAKWDTDAKGD